MHFRRVVMLLSAIALAACSQPKDEPAATKRELPPLDSITVHKLDAFRARVGPKPDHLDGERSRDALVQAFVKAVGTKDTTALARLALTPAEYAWLYYPDAPFSRPPYGLDPETMWIQLDARSSRGIERILQRYGGQLAFQAYTCEPTPVSYGAITLWERCAVTHVRNHLVVSERLFGAIVERDGWFKFVGLSNQL